MSVPAHKKSVTAEDLFQHPEWDPCELIEGEVVPLVPTGLSHMRVTHRLCYFLHCYEDTYGTGKGLGSGGGIILARDPDTVRAADACFILNERLPEGDLPDGFCTVIPDMCAEVASPGQTRPFLDRKVRQVLEAGVRMVWLIVPSDRTVHVYLPDGSEQVYQEHDALAGGGVMPGFSLPVAELFK